MPLVTTENFWHSLESMEQEWCHHGHISPTWHTVEGQCTLQGGGLLPLVFCRRLVADNFPHIALAVEGPTLGPEQFHVPGLARMVGGGGLPSTLVFHASLPPYPPSFNFLGYDLRKWAYAPYLVSDPQLRQQLEEAFALAPPSAPESLTLPCATPLLLRFLERKQVIR